MAEKCSNWFVPISVTYHSDYSKIFSEAALFAVSFGYREPLFELMLQCTLQSEVVDVGLLFCSHPLYIEMERGKLNVRNYKNAEEREEKEAMEQPPGTYQ